ncbi:transcription initiation factor TFIID [Paenibacillus spiritus]|uniref:Transcription initiation factor TFIID n=1 Tax=Paenibacillus spiritus TaxID=2496557 RepID=A0A5J5G9E4_9BACL|nr:transcription initiation factor TFIID [Paenibacillus spiritus]KAA9004716.1 transcription initiation factor TFIID [Paenibacillus spiritus]
MGRAMLEQFADGYALREEAQQGSGDGRTSIHYPALFLFLGARCEPAISPVVQSCRRKWDNAGGVLALHAAPEEASDAGEPSPGAAPKPGLPDLAVRKMALPAVGGRDPRTVRRDVWRAFQEQSAYLAGMNTALRRISNEIADYGRLYSSFDVIHLSIVTMVDDPANILLPQIALLARTVLAQSFKSVRTDLFVLISEREQAEHFGYASSAGLAFLRELDGMQASDYALTAPLLVTEDGLSIPVSHGPAPLFDLVYCLSDKNERGIVSPRGMEDNYEMISHISLLKNAVRPAGGGASAGHGPGGYGGQGGYNNAAFKSGIRGVSGRETYASAGFAEVTRPNRQIALAVLYHLLRLLAGQLRQSSGLSPRERLGLMGMDEASLRERARRLLPEPEELAEMNGLMAHTQPSFAELRRLSLREAEELLFGEGAESYFRANFEAPAGRRLEEADPERELLRSLAAMPAPPNFMQLARWTADRDEAGSVRHSLRQHMAGLRSAIATAREELAGLYAAEVGRLPIPRVPLLDKRTVRNAVRYLFEEAYGRRYGILRLETELALCRRLEDALDRLNAENGRRARLMEELEEELRAAAMEAIGRNDSDTGRNIMEYYAGVTEQVLAEAESRRGPGVWFTERMLGDPAALLDRGGEAFLRELVALCEREVLASPAFGLPFEEELLRRANVAAAYENREVLPKEELFRRLYRNLEEGAAVNVRLLQYTQEHRHEEKYFFGDSGSEFLRYALAQGETTRNYRVGFVHEERRSGVSKLNLMGGFHLEDLLYYRNGRIYYETYLQNGYELHADESGDLPPLRG